MRIVFTLEKKRTKQKERRTKLIIGDVDYIHDYYTKMKENCPESKYLFPRTFYSPVTLKFIIKGDYHLSGREVLRVVKTSNRARFTPFKLCFIPIK